MEISGDVTNARHANKQQRTREDRATHPMDAGWRSFTFHTNFLSIPDYVFQMGLNFLDVLASPGSL